MHNGWSSTHLINSCATVHSRFIWPFYRKNSKTFLSKKKNKTNPFRLNQKFSSTSFNTRIKIKICFVFISTFINIYSAIHNDWIICPDPVSLTLWSCFLFFFKLAKCIEIIHWVHGVQMVSLTESLSQQWMNHLIIADTRDAQHKYMPNAKWYSMYHSGLYS